LNRNKLEDLINRFSLNDRVVGKIKSSDVISILEKPLNIDLLDREREELIKDSNNYLVEAIKLCSSKTQ